VRTERERALERLRRTDLGRSDPALEALPLDSGWHAPITPDPALGAVLVNVEPARVAEVRQILSSFGDVSVYSQDEERELLLGGMVQRAKMQLGLFSLILSIPASVIVALVIYNMSLDKTHDLAVLALLGGSPSRRMGLIVEQALLLGASGYAFALGLGYLIYPSFPRRVLLTPEILWGAPIVILLLTLVASLAGVVHASRVDVGRVLES
jgi:putative ABC transport system permease protein